MNLKLFAKAAGSTLIFAFLASPAFANIVACASGNLSTIDHATCDIGNLQFTFTGFFSTNYSANPIDPSLNYNKPWSDTDFTFTVLSNGFELSGPPPQTITSLGGVDNYEAIDNAELAFHVTDLTGTIASVAVSGGNPSVFGPGPAPGDSYAENYLEIDGSVFNFQQEIAKNLIYDASGNIENGLGLYSSFRPPIASGSGFAVPFDLFSDGYGASIDSTTADFTFTTGSAPPPPSPVPEPRLLTLLGIGVFGLVSAARRKLPRQDCKDI